MEAEVCYSRVICFSLILSCSLKMEEARRKTAEEEEKKIKRKEELERRKAEEEARMLAQMQAEV